MNDIIDYIKNSETISVVCNGASLLKNTYGEEIDSSDIVIRMNHGALNYLSYKKQLGERIDIFVTNGWVEPNYKKVLNYLINLKENDMVIFSRPIESNLKHMLYVDPEFKKILNLAKFSYIDIKQEFFIDNAIDGYYNFSTGIILLLFLSNICESHIKVFGIDNFKTSHFYNNKIESGGHNVKIEELLLNSLINNKKVIKYG